MKFLQKKLYTASEKYRKFNDCHSERSEESSGIVPFGFIIFFQCVWNGIFLKFLFILVFAVFTILPIFVFDSCSEPTIYSNRDIVFPDSNVSFSLQVQLFMSYTCSYSGCHSDETSAGGIRLTEYFSYWEGKNVGMVIPGQPDNSRLVQYLEGKLVIPHYYAYNWTINSNQKKGIRQWIKEGAINN